MLTVFKSILLNSNSKSINQNYDFVFVSNDVDKSATYKGKQFDRVLGPIIEEIRALGFSYLCITFPFSWYKSSKYFHLTASINRPYFLASTIDKLLGNIRLKSKMRRRVFRKVLQKTRPRAIFCIGFPADLCFVSRELNIPVFEVLHGTGYATIPPYVQQLSEKEAPDYVVVSDLISKQTFDISNLYEVLYVEPFWKNFSYSEEINSTNKESNTKPTVIFSLQWGFDGDEGIYSEYKGILENGLMPNELIEAATESSSHINWRFRLHPVQQNNPNYREAINRLDRIVNNIPNADWKQTSQISIEEVFRKATHHLTMDSMMAYEAADHGVKTLLLSPLLEHLPSHKEKFKDLIKEGFATKGMTSKSEILNWISSTSVTSKRNIEISKGGSLIGEVLSLLKLKP